MIEYVAGLHVSKIYIVFHCYALQCKLDRSLYLYSTQDLLSVVNRFGTFVQNDAGGFFGVPCAGLRSERVDSASPRKCTVSFIPSLLG